MASGYQLLKLGRAIKGLTQKEVAKHCGVSVATYQMWERGKSAIRFETMINLCENLFHIEIEELQRISSL